ncbi:hypothetical protein D9M71_711350 [compost metagenome]
MAASIGRPAVPPGSPSSLLRYCAPSFQAQQLWVAARSLWRSMKLIASAALLIGPARVMKRLLRISSRYSQRSSRVEGIKDSQAAGLMPQPFKMMWIRLLLASSMSCLVRRLRPVTWQIWVAKSA